MSNLINFIKGIFGQLKPQDLLSDAIALMVTPDVAQEIQNTVVTAAKLDMTGAEKKAQVMQHLVSLKGMVGNNITKIGEKLISRAIDVTVSRLKLDKVIQ